MIARSFSRRRLGATYVFLVVTLLASAASAFAAPPGTSAKDAGHASELGLLAFTAPLTTPTPTYTPVSPPVVYSGRLGALVRVADGCSHYPLTQCDGKVVDITPRMPDILAAYVGRDVRVVTSNGECGRGIAGQPLYGPVADSAQPAAPCATPVPTPSVSIAPCPFITGRVPSAAISAAMANPSQVNGYGLRCNPALPASPANTYRSNLSLLSPGRPFHPTYNSLVLKCGCP